MRQRTNTFRCDTVHLDYLFVWYVKYDIHETDPKHVDVQVHDGYHP